MSKTYPELDSYRISDNKIFNIFLLMGYFGNFLRNTLLYHNIPFIGPILAAASNFKNFSDLFNNTFNGASADSVVEDGLSNLYNKYFGTGLTQSEEDANQFTHDERIDAQNWTAQREDTMYQRRVADLQAAGINPMLAAGSSPVNASPSSGNSSVGPSSGTLSDLLQLFVVPQQIRTMQAQRENIKADTDLKAADAANKNADAANKNADTALKEWQLQYNKLTQDLDIESKRYANEAKRAEGRLFWKKVDECEAHMTKLIEEAHTEQERQLAIRMKAKLDDASASEIAALLPYRQKLMSATAALQNKQAEGVDADISLKAAQEGLALVEKMYKENLITDGYLDAFVREQKAKAKSAEDKQMIDDIAAAIRTNQPLPVNDVRWNRPISSTIGYLLAGVANTFDNFEPLFDFISNMSN